ncbi:hypothetical protein PbB2_01019 [Candidatus Phycosocius bacilliformis]|uniref:HTH merR-type domain-containing protein n=1 Tax=Candidatus Phycosocius bacilliformis TaxID=1445552 RepID=A0A2P2E8G0_9PROT|nr:MerR family transcriptional regulator [Candidatus Phycosocius bacilliformis]GBF57353.1 hypothetical protein PbB2_01019 [Candidatus Phycosocius bacilliformis]
MAAGIEKGEQAFRTITEAAELLDVPAHVLRFWEGKFPQLRPLKRAGGRRHYRPEDMALLRGIRALLQEDGYQLKGVQKVLKEQGVAHVRARGGGVGASSPAPILVGIGADRDRLALGAAARGPVFPLSDKAEDDESIAEGSRPEASTPVNPVLDRARLQAALTRLERADALLAAAQAGSRR